MDLINYFHEKDSGIEVITCNSSSVSYPVHNHVSVFTIGMVVDGAIDLTVNKTAKCCHSNQTFVIPPYVPHEITAHGEYTLVSCCINRGLLGSVSLYVIKSIIIALLNEAMAYSGITAVQPVILKLMKSVDLLQGVTVKRGSSGRYLQELIEQLELCPEKQICVDDMARSVFISKYHLIRQFKEETGLTPHRFVIQNRIRKAQRLLHKYNKMTEVALATGFCDQSHFIRHFERMVGLTPAAYQSACIPVCLTSVGQDNAGINLANR